MFRLTKNTIATSICALSTLLSAPVFAKSPAITEPIPVDSVNSNSSYFKKILNLDEVVITGTRTPKSYSKSPVLTKIITSRSLETAATTSLEDALLDNIPGLVADDNPMGSNLKLKGLTSRYILFMLDGQPLMKEGASGYVDLNQINIDDIDHIEYLGGAASALYGSNAVGAVINFISKKSTKKWAAGLNVINGSNDTKRLSVDVNNNNRLLSTKWSGFRASSDGFGDISKENLQYAYLNYGSNLALNLHASDYWDAKATGSFYQHTNFQEADERGAIIDDLKRKFNASLVTNIYNSDKSNILSLSGNYQVYNAYKIVTKRDKALASTIYKTELLDTWTPNTNLQIIGGAGYDYKDVWSKTLLGSTPTRRSLEESHALAQADWNIIDDLNLIGGVRYTNNQSFGSSFDPKVSLMYTLNNWKFRTGFSTAFRAPTVRELYYNFSHGPNLHVVGNPNLGAENGKYYSISAEYTYANFNASINGFYNAIDDKIDQTYTMNKGSINYSYSNVSKAVLKGFDVNAAWAINTHWLLRGSYSYCDAKNDKTGSQLANNMRHTGNTSITWSPVFYGEPMSFLVSGRFSSPQKYIKIELNKATRREVNIKDKSKAYKIIKAAYSKAFKIKDQTLKLSFKVDNLFDFKDDTYNSSGRTYTFGVSYHYN